MIDLTCEMPRLDGPVLLTCQVATPDSLVLGFDATYWTMMTAVASIALAVFALLAWLASTHTLRLMRSQERTTAAAAQAQLDDQASGRQIDALANYSAAIMDLISMPTPILIDGGRTDILPPQYQLPPGMTHPSEVAPALTRVQATGRIWRLHHSRQDSSVYELELYEVDVIELFRQSRKGRGQWSDGVRHARILLDSSEEWQIDPSRHARIIRETLKNRREIHKLLGWTEDAGTNGQSRPKGQT